MFFSPAPPTPQTGAKQFERYCMVADIGKVVVFPWTNSLTRSSDTNSKTKGIIIAITITRTGNIVFSDPAAPKVVSSNPVVH